MVESAVRGGHEVVSVDFFGDRDLARLAESYALQRDLGLPRPPEGLGQAAQRVGRRRRRLRLQPGEPPRGGRTAGLPTTRLLGNPPDVLREVSDWALLRRACEESGIAHPVTLLPGEEARAGPAAG